jgi:hypothetical protein
MALHLISWKMYLLSKWKSIEHSASFLDFMEASKSNFKVTSLEHYVLRFIFCFCGEQSLEVFV